MGDKGKSQVYSHRQIINIEFIWTTFFNLAIITIKIKIKQLGKNRKIIKIM